MLDLPASAGTYLLVLRLPAPVTLTIGKLGTFHFLAGWVVYVGSAMGSGGLRGRLSHHLSPVSKPHWHIDYLRRAAVVTDVWYRADGLSHEHEWADVLLSRLNGDIPVLRFGASDCACRTHLFRFGDRPDFAGLESLPGLSQIQIRPPD